MYDFIDTYQYVYICKYVILMYADVQTCQSQDCHFAYLQNCMVLCCFVLLRSAAACSCGLYWQSSSAPWSLRRTKWVLTWKPCVRHPAYLFRKILSYIRHAQKWLNELVLTICACVCVPLRVFVYFTLGTGPTKEWLRFLVAAYSLQSLSAGASTPAADPHFLGSCWDAMSDLLWFSSKDAQNPGMLLHYFRRNRNGACIFKLDLAVMYFLRVAGRMWDMSTFLLQVKLQCELCYQHPMRNVEPPPRTAIVEI